jgi:hypothetical protein
MFGFQADVVAIGYLSNNAAETRVGVADVAGIAASMITCVGKAAVTPFVGMRADTGKRIAGMDITLINATQPINRLAPKPVRVPVVPMAITITAKPAPTAAAIKFL